MAFSYETCTVITDSYVQPTSTLFTEQARPKIQPSCETPEDCFSLFFDDNLIQYIVDQTNTYARKKIAGMQVDILFHT